MSSDNEQTWSTPGNELVHILGKISGGTRKKTTKMISWGKNKYLEKTEQQKYGCFPGWCMRDVIILAVWDNVTYWREDCVHAATLDPIGNEGQEGCLGVGSSCTCPDWLGHLVRDLINQRALMNWVVTELLPSAELLLLLLSCCYCWCCHSYS